MVVVNKSVSEINAKIVYYGPALSGKTTNLEQIYERMPPDAKGKMVSMKTRTDRTLFFDFLPLELGELKGFRTRMLLYTVPGQVYYNATRKLVLKGADAVVFVADSGASKAAENIESLRNLEENLNELGLTLDTIPWVIQYNKRDLPDAVPVRTLENELNLLRVPSHEAVATRGIGVYETFQGIAGILYSRLAERLSVPVRKSAQPAAPPQPKERVPRDRAPDEGVTQAVEVALREVSESRPPSAPVQPQKAPPAKPALPAERADSRQPGRETPRLARRGPQTGGRHEPIPAESGDDAFRFASLEAGPVDEHVGRVIDLERRAASEAGQSEGDASSGLFITDPCRSSGQSEVDAGDLGSSISKIEALTLKDETVTTREEASGAGEECVITVPVLLERSQIRKTIPIKLRLEVQFVDDE
jgi:signal recognition particle receptor subunit beta